VPILTLPVSSEHTHTHPPHISTEAEFHAKPSASNKLRPWVHPTFSLLRLFHEVKQCLTTGEKEGRKHEMRSQRPATGAGLVEKHRQKSRLPKERLHYTETGRKVTSTRGKAGVDTTLGNSFSMNSPTTAFLKTGIQPTLSNGCIQEVSWCASKEKAHPIRYHQGPPSGSNVQEAQLISPLAQTAVKLRRDSAHRHARQHLFLLNS